MTGAQAGFDSPRCHTTVRSLSVLRRRKDRARAEAARRLHAQGVKRLPVVDAVGRLVGIVSRTDLLTSFLRSDEELQREIVDDVIYDDLLMAPSRFDVHVQDGVVVLQGCCERRSLIPMVVRAVASVEGVVQVVNRLGYDIDDLSSPLPESLARPAV